MIDYLILVNKNNRIPDDFMNNVKFKTFRNFRNEDLLIEENCLVAFLKLRNELSSWWVKIDIEDWYRSIEEQQRVFTKFENLYWKEYVDKYVAVPWFSEHHTWLAIDIQLIREDKKSSTNDELLNEDFSVIHSKLCKYGFILRYPQWKENITWYWYEPWHIRFVWLENINKFEGWLTLEEIFL